MDLDVSPYDADVRAEAIAWLTGWLPGDYEQRFAEYRLDLEFRSAYQRDAFDAGWLVPSWPRELGGHDVGPEADLRIKLDFARHGAPKLPNVQGPGVVAHALLAYGDESQRAHVRPVVRGDLWWCLGMSEPEAGSDLAAMRTRARRVDDHFVIDGQKVWTSHARQAKFCLLFARTGTEGPRHKTISAFVVPMDAPGITTTPIRKIGAEDEEFCEVFFDSVQVPASGMLGGLGEGWTVAMSSLTAERDMIWIMNLVECERALAICLQGLRRRARPELAIELAWLLGDCDAIWLTGLRGLAARLTGRPDHESAILKVMSTEAAQRAFALAARVVGDTSVLVGERAPFGGEIADGELEALGATLYGGTSEIQRNIIGERVLGLPRR
jgi:alkylation response protein AidB-like acyl-CoA dehydrogenase